MRTLFGHEAVVLHDLKATPDRKALSDWAQRLRRVQNMLRELHDDDTPPAPRVARKGIVRPR